MGEETVDVEGVATAKVDRLISVGLAEPTPPVITPNLEARLDTATSPPVEAEE